MDGTEQLKKIKEINDIVFERNETQRLLSEANWDELNRHLQNLNTKYFVETLVYNTANPNPPKNIQENAQNCILFLNSLLSAKTVDTTKTDKYIK